MFITFNSKTFKIWENNTKCRHTEERNVLFSQFVLMSRKNWLIPYNTRTKKECEPHHSPFQISSKFDGVITCIEKRKLVGFSQKLILNHFFEVQQENRKLIIFFSHMKLNFLIYRSSDLDEPLIGLPEAPNSGSFETFWTLTVHNKVLVQ